MSAASSSSSPFTDAVAPPTAAPQPTLLTPVTAHERIAALDVLRGLALLGILMVNMVVFTMPLSALMTPDLKSMPISELVAWAFMMVFFQYKFISLFSLLFGAGLIVQMVRAEQRGRAFMPLYIRRLVVLALIGALHGILLWYGDILFIYACLGFILLLFRWLSAKAMLWVAGSILAGLVFFQAGVGVLVVIFGDAIEAVMHSSRTQQRHVSPTAELATTAPEASGIAPASESVATQPVVEESQSEETSASDALVESVATQPATRPRRSFAERNPRLAERLPWLVPMVDANFDINSRTWTDAETRAYKHGPFFDALAFRTITWVFAVLAACFGFGWHSLAMFLVGAAMMKLQFFTAENQHWHRRLMLIGLLVAFPLELIAIWMTYHGMVAAALDVMLFGAAIHEIGSALLCLGIVGAVCVALRNGVRGPARMIGYAGRMGLTNYLMQTVIATSLMYWWGLGWFGEVSRVEQIGLVISIWAGQVVLSTLWFQIFAIGPAEWLWRSLTYLRLQPVFKQSAQRSQAPG